jgi:tetratricopeptide (TPR) repeat protein
MVWLGDAYLAAGNANAADQQFARAIALQPSLAAARSGAGRAALAKREYRRAVEQLNEALKLEPQATSIHYPLAMAYRGLGDVAQSEAHLAQQGKIDPRPPDSLMREIDGLLESAEAYNVRGGAELAAGHWQAAAEQFRKGLELSPSEPHFDSALARLSTRWETSKAPRNSSSRCSERRPTTAGRISALACCSTTPAGIPKLLTIFEPH